MPTLDKNAQKVIRYTMQISDWDCYFKEEFLIGILKKFNPELICLCALSSVFCALTSEWLIFRMKLLILGHCAFLTSDLHYVHVVLAPTFSDVRIPFGV